MAAAAEVSQQRLFRRLWVHLRRPNGQSTSSPIDDPVDGATDPSEKPTDEGPRPLLLPLSLAALVGMVLSVPQSPFGDAFWPFRWPSTAFGVSDAIAAQGLLTAIALGAVLQGRGAADRITALRNVGPAVLAAEERNLVRRYRAAAGISGAVACVSVFIGGSSVVHLLHGDVFAAAVLGFVTALVTSLSSFVSATSREARAALQREHDRRREREVRVLRRVQATWALGQRPARRHGTCRVVVAVASLSVALGLAGAWALEAQMPALGLLLLTAAPVPPVVTFTVVCLVRAAAQQRALERVGPWAGFVPLWFVLLVVPVYLVGVLGGSRWWWAIATSALLVVHVVSGGWAVRGLFRQHGVFRHLRPGIAGRVAARADALQRPATTKPTTEPRLRLVRDWRVMTGSDARDEERLAGGSGRDLGRATTSSRRTRPS
ncbi:hypothetical protein [Pseudokineococcus sp. 1T1Z-3]|uniref:hypothetical protein n=1 Tax=Pseudokineococcus sp. 1T1Z-3 TaxID=3132745 RepID=UPI00309B8351